MYVLTKTYNISKVDVSKIFVELLKENIFQTLSKEIILIAFELYSIINLDFVDCILCATNKVSGIKVKTFDKSLTKCLNSK